ncbi:aminotransferase class I/II-fold pyridoxal phosphate-dependent enzyme [Leucobacter aridicollis]|nr:aminotransferase class I/II-fold pyridoxal phosphate-dependent enzyme [Leucobacter aridicollis]
MSGMADCLETQSADPSGVPFAELDPALLRTQRTSLKWTRFPEDTLPLFVAEMDFAVAPEIRRTLVERIEASDLGYLDGPGPLAGAFADFARDRWGWEVPHERIHLATDVATGVVESLRVLAPNGTRVVVPTPVYPGFFEMLEELPFEIAEVPLTTGSASDGHAPAGLDLAAIEREFAAGADVFLLCNPHNPHGIAYTRDELTELARLAAAHGVAVVSDEIHAPLTHSGVTFTPFAPLAAAAGALSVTTISASKGWNIAGTKCAVIVAADDRANRVLADLPPETVTRASILGLHASVAAFNDGRDWLDRAVAQIEANVSLLAELVPAELPGVHLAVPRAGYLAWLDLRDAGLGDDPYTRVLEDAKVALNNGAFFGAAGAGHVRLNLACAPDTIREAVRRIASILPARTPGPTEPSSGAPSSTAPAPTTPASTAALTQEA